MKLATLRRKSVGLVLDDPILASLAALPTAAHPAGALSLSIWIIIVFFGRWIGFTT